MTIFGCTVTSKHSVCSNIRYQLRMLHHNMYIAFGGTSLHRVLLTKLFLHYDIIPTIEKFQHAECNKMTDTNSKCFTNICCSDWKFCNEVLIRINCCLIDETSSTFANVRQLLFRGCQVRIDVVGGAFEQLQ